MNTSNKIYTDILDAKKKGKKLLAILLDPDKINITKLENLIENIINSPATHIFVGGSIVNNNIIDELIINLKSKINLPILLFPGDPSQISIHAHGILFLNLISGRNPKYLIEHQVNAVPVLKNSNLEIISTGYILIDGGKTTAVERVSETSPMPQNNANAIVSTAIAGYMMGQKLIYLEAGSGANVSVSKEIISLVSKNVSIPVIVGGGIKNFEQINKAYTNGADLVVIGTAFENNPDFFKQ